MARPDKAAAVAEITDRFRASNAAVLTEYRGLTVAQLTALRKSIAANATYAVVKNTLTAIAAKEAGITAFEGQLTGPTAIAFVTGDPVEAAKGLRDFAKTNPALVIKGGVLDGQGPVRRRGEEARRPGVARGAAGQAGRRHEGVAEQGRVPVRRSAVQGGAHDRRPARRSGEDASVLRWPARRLAAEAAPPRPKCRRGRGAR